MIYIVDYSSISYIIITILLGDLMPPQQKTNYLNNKDLLHEIHLSKKSYCSYINDSHADYDLILTISLDAFTEIDIDKISNIINDPLIIELAQKSRAKKIQELSYIKAIEQFKNKPSTTKQPKPKQRDFLIDHCEINKHDLVFRVMTYSHIPESPGRKKKPKNISETRERVNFPPFKHFMLASPGGHTEVCRSHWEGSIHNGKFSTTTGRITQNLGAMFLKLVERFSQKGNWRGYTYADEMRGTALVNLSQVGLQFNEAKSKNPFAYYTAAATNSFTRILLQEKKNQKMRDDILQSNGFLPSFNRQAEHDTELYQNRENLNHGSD